MKNEHEEEQEQHLRFVAKHYREGSLDTDKAWKQFARRHAIERPAHAGYYLLRVAAVVLLFVGIGGYYVWEQSRPEWVAISTVAGQIKDVYLPDSTLISLAGGSSVRYRAKDYGKERRVVEMKGKAFFQVMRNEARPFSIETNLAEVRVLGTRFQVETSDEVVEVNVASGKVRFTATQTDKQVILTAGMSAQYTAGRGGMEVREEEEANYLSWRTGQLHFTDTPLEQVIQDVEACYQVTITNRVPRADAKLTASFDNRSLEEVLTVINQTLDVRLLSDQPQ